VTHASEEHINIVLDTRVCFENGSGGFLGNVDNHLPHHILLQNKSLQNIDLENCKELLSFIISHDLFFLQFLLM
jgi:hypothetical protein